MAREQVTEIVAEMVANVLSVAVAPGDVVAAGDTVVLLESMKMEIPVIAEAAGTVRAVRGRARRRRPGGRPAARPRPDALGVGSVGSGRGGGIRTRG